MIKKLASIKVTFWSLIALAGCLGIGAGLTNIKLHAKTIRIISEQLPLAWLVSSNHDDSLIMVWFLLTCLAAGFLFTNVLCCTGLRIATIRKNSQAIRQWLFVLIHCMFAAVMLCHGLGMVAGYKISNVDLWPGNTRSFASGYTVSLSEAVFSDNPDILKADYQARRSLMTRESFHPENNFARITVTHNGQHIQSGQVFMLCPLVANGIQFTMTDFKFQKDAPHPIGVSLVITKNPVRRIFFIAYAMLILSLIGFACYTWNPSKN